MYPEREYCSDSVLCLNFFVFFCVLFHLVIKLFIIEERASRWYDRYQAIKLCVGILEKNKVYKLGCIQKNCS